MLRHLHGTHSQRDLHRSNTNTPKMNFQLISHASSQPKIEIRWEDGPLTLIPNIHIDFNGRPGNLERRSSSTNEPSISKCVSSLINESVCLSRVYAYLEVAARRPVNGPTVEISNSVKNEKGHTSYRFVSRVVTGEWMNEFNWIYFCCAASYAAIVCFRNIYSFSIAAHPSYDAYQRHTRISEEIL